MSIIINRLGHYAGTHGIKIVTLHVSLVQVEQSSAQHNLFPEDYAEPSDNKR